MRNFKNEGKAKVMFFWPGLIISIILSIFLTLLLNIFL